MERSETASLQPKMPKRKRGIERVEALLDAAAATFLEKGFDAATTSEIAERAGASIGSLYQFFPTKESVADLGLAPGREAMALIKSSFVILAAGDEPVRTSARNRLSGTVARHEVGAVNDEVKRGSTVDTVWLRLESGSVVQR